MHVAGKVFLGLGVVMLLVGGIMTVMGGESLEEAGDWDVAGLSDFEGPDGEWNHDGMDWMVIFVTTDVDCESFDVTYTAENGSTGHDWDGDGVEDESYFAKEDCDYADDGTDPEGFYSIGSFNGDKGTYTVDATHGHYTVPAFEALGGVLAEAGGGILGILGGVGLAGCGICSLVLGGVLALVLKDPQPTVVMQQNQ